MANGYEVRNFPSDYRLPGSPDLRTVNAVRFSSTPNGATPVELAPETPSLDSGLGRTALQQPDQLLAPDQAVALYLPNQVHPEATALPGGAQ